MLFETFLWDDLRAALFDGTAPSEPGWVVDAIEAISLTRDLVVLEGVAYAAPALTAMTPPDFLAVHTWSEISSDPVDEAAVRALYGAAHRVTTSRYPEGAHFRGTTSNQRA